MKLSPHLADIDRAFAALLDHTAPLDQPALYRNAHQGRRIRRDLPSSRPTAEVPCIIPAYPSYDVPLSNTAKKERLLQLAAFEATYHEQPTPISPEMFPIIIDTGASVTVTPCATDFITPIRPVQSVEIKGIAAGLQVRGYGDVRYSFYNDAGQKQHLHLRNCLYVPQCTSRLIWTRQIGISTGHPADGFTSHAEQAYLIVQGQRTTVKYDTISSVPLLYTAPGIQSFHRFCAQQSYLTKASDMPISDTVPAEFTPFLYRNLTKAQQQKLHLHERCAHVHWDQLNSWIRQGSTLRYNLSVHS